MSTLILGSSVRMNKRNNTIHVTHLHDFYGHFFPSNRWQAINLMAVYEVITVHRHAANYKLINNRIPDTGYEFERILLHMGWFSSNAWLSNIKPSRKNANNNILNCHERTLEQKCWAI